MATYWRHTFMQGLGPACDACGEGYWHPNHTDDARDEERKKIDWDAAETHLRDVVSSLMHQGSLGITRFFGNAHDAWTRFYAGERTEELYNTIMKLQ